MLCLYLEAPFAACRTFTAGWYRPTATFLTPTAAYGLVLNVAAIESRLYEHEKGHDGRTPASLTRPSLPAVRLALAALPSGAAAGLPRVQSLYQQLHNYPVGKDAGTPVEWAHGTKNNITPVRREYLTGLRALVCVDGNHDLEERVRRGLRGEFNSSRYGLPFLGDNQFLVDRLEEWAWPLSRPAYWYERVEEQSGGPRLSTARLTTWVDRAEMSRTRSALYAPVEVPSADVPAVAWTDIPPPTSPPAPAPPLPQPRRRKA
jgi:CRISPR-associated protein Cas5t